MKLTVSSSLTLAPVKLLINSTGIAKKTKPIDHLSPLLDTMKLTFNFQRLQSIEFDHQFSLLHFLHQTIVFV